jgi:hypothetical protein
VWSALGGELRHSRGRAWWRDGDGWSVALDDRRGCWYDHRDGIGGGVLDLLTHVRGGTPQDALRWLADFIGVTLDDRPPDRMTASEYGEAQRIKLDALYFSDAARLMAEWALDELSPTDPERAVHTALIAGLCASPEAEYRAWLKHQPESAAALVNAGRARAKRLQVALARYLVAEVLDAA